MSNYVHKTLIKYIYTSTIFLKRIEEYQINWKKIQYNSILEIKIRSKIIR